MCTYATVNTDIAGSAKGPEGSWFRVSHGTVYFDHPALLNSVSRDDLLSWIQAE